ncbi:MAG: adenylate/guanylate cyclase domain-containing protein [Dongiaceae bacterium]
MTEIETLLRRAEIAGERTAAVFRLVIFLTLLAVIFSVTEGDGGHAPLFLTAAVYGAGTVVGLLLAWRKLFHPLIPYAFVTFDIGLLTVQLLMLTGAMGMSSTLVFSLPAAALVYVFLVHASMRYRPWLVVYAAALFLVGMGVGEGLIGAAGGAAFDQMRGNAPMRGPEAMGGFAQFAVFPVAIVSLCALILFVISRRTRRLLLESIEQGRRASRLARYFSPNLAGELAATPEAELLAGRRQPVAVLFADVRGFTGMAETMSTQELGTFLSAFRTRLTRPVFALGGTVDKFIGDAVMVVFGTPRHQTDDASRALACALAMLEEAGTWSDERVREGKPAVAIGIGVHYGEVFAGALGDHQVLEYTVIGDTVNVAERLEKLTREVDASLVVSAPLLRAAGEAGEAPRWRRLPAQQLRGHRQPIEVFARLQAAQTGQASAP